MKKVPIYYWRYDHERKPGKRIKTRYAMSVEDAQERLRGLNPERVEPPFMVLDIAETEEEKLAASRAMYHSINTRPAGKMHHEE